MQLVRPSLKYSESWYSALKEFEEEGLSGFWHIPSKPQNLEEYIQRTEDHSQNINIPDNWMQATTFWLIDQNQFIGHVNLRHTLVD